MSAFTLRLIAVLAMLCDHIGYCWGVEILRIIGRIAFPLLGGSHHGYPFELALECAKEAFETYTSENLEVFLILKEKD